MKQLITALQKIAELAPERRHAKAPRGDALARQRIGQIARAVLAQMMPTDKPAREYAVEIMATNRTVLVNWQGHARNRLHALTQAMCEIGYRMDIDKVTISKVGGSSRGKGAESARVIADRAREGERAAFNADMRAYFAQRREDDEISDRISDKVIVQRAPCETN